MSAATCSHSCASQRCQAQQPPSALRLGPTAAPRPVASLGRPSLALQCRRRSVRQQQQVRPLSVSAAASSDGETVAAAGGGGSGSSGHGSGRHAFLHDFCMCIPYGALVAAGGLAGKLFGWGQPAAVMMVVGGLQMFLSYMSLKMWRQRKSAAPFTIVEAGLAGWMGYYAFRAVQQGFSPIIMGCLLGLSTAMSLFLAYNVAAGGNPPPRVKHAAVAPTLAAEPTPAS